MMNYVQFQAILLSNETIFQYKFISKNVESHRGTLPKQTNVHFSIFLMEKSPDQVK